MSESQSELALREDCPQSNSETLSEILEEITSKKDWYSKVFDETITQKWTAEIAYTNKDEFWLALRILQATAQGVVHDDKCEWSEQGHYGCKKCKEEFREDLQKDFDDFGYQSFAEALKDIDELFEQTDMDCTHVKCECTSPNHLLCDYVIHQNNIVDDELHNQLQMQVVRLEKAMVVDYHPELQLDNQNVLIKKSLVRDLVHPSLYCYVKGISVHNNGRKEEGCSENERYAWLPAQVEVTNGKASFTSYINNLDDLELIRSLEHCLSSFLPALEKILKQKMEKLQVIVKLATIELDQEHPDYAGGAWHIEGMPYEHIAATCLHYLQVTGISDSYLEFRKPVYLNEQEVDYPQCDEKYTEHHFGITPHSHYDGEMNRYLGLIKCTEGSSVVFPNSLQHRVKPFSLTGSIPPETVTEKKVHTFSSTNAELMQRREKEFRREQLFLAKKQEKAKQGKRTIIAFFVIDPEQPIISTADVPKQQAIFTREEADYYRQQLMIQRKYFVDKLNKVVFEREYSLCEH